MSKRTILQKDNNLPQDLGTWLAQMKEVRRRLLKIIEAIEEEALDFTPSERSIETIGTLLLHIAAVEWSWILEDLFQQEFDYEEWKYAFPLRSSINLPQLKNQGKKFYLERLRTVRDEIMVKLSEITDLSRTVIVEGQEYSIEWILFHLIEHEALHIGQVNFLNRLFKLKVRM